MVVAACTYENDIEQRLHAQAIQMLALDLDRPLEEIRRNYETMLCSLKEGAKIKEYLVILVSRKVRDVITKKNTDTQEF